MGYGWSKHAKEELAKGHTIEVSPRGNSMTPKIKSGQKIRLEPLGDRVVKKGAIVFCKVNGNEYVHLVTAIRNNGESVQISNNHGHVNGWTNKKNIFGIVTKVY